MRSRVDPPHKSPAYVYGALALLASIAVILAAWGFEILGGYRPCPLCLQQRWAYYAAIPGLFLALVCYTSGRTTTAGLLFLLVSLGFLANAGLGVYHAGAEWKFWPGPDTCGTTALTSNKAGGLLQGMQAPVMRCDEAPWRFLGLSFAGWNIVTSGLLWITSQAAAFAASGLRRP